MLKKLLAGSIIFLSMLSSAYAEWSDRYWGCVYLAPSLAYESIHANPNTRYEGVNPVLALGYGGLIKQTYPVYIAIELFGAPKSITIHNDKFNNPGLKTGFNLGGSIIPGLYLDDVILAYVRVGMLSTNFADFDATRTGFQVGVGLQARLNSVWDLRGEYDYTSYSSIDGLGSIKSGTYMIGVVYSLMG